MRILIHALLCLVVGLLAAARPARAADRAADRAAPFDWTPESGKLLATAGVTQLEGQGGGGLVPWALITGYGTKDAVGANAHYTYVHTGRFDLHTAGAAIGLYDRVELSLARQWFDTRGVGGKLGLGDNYTFGQTIVGVKLRLFGDAVYDQDRWLPQIAVGMQYKSNNRPALLSAIGAKSAQGVDLYIAGTKLFFAESLLLNATVRATKANQFGLLGFGGDRNNGYTAQFEGSAAYLLSRKLAIGGEFRTKPDKLGFAREDHAWDLFAAWFIDKHASATLAYVNLGRVAGEPNQSGVYFSLQAGF